MSIVINNTSLQVIADMAACCHAGTSRFFHVVPKDLRSKLSRHKHRLIEGEDYSK
jgi:hypothetical protein